MPHNQSLRSGLSEKDKKLVELVLNYKDRFQNRRWIFEREWYRNILFYVGQQWIVYDEGFRRWRLRNLPSWVPLPVTNRLASTANVIRSSVAQVQPAFTAYPTRENEKSILSANAADKYLEVIMQESGFRAAKRRLASWVTFTGNGFLLNEFDTSTETGTITIPGEKCLDCGASIKPSQIQENLTCPTCGSSNLQEDQSIGETIPQGRIRVSAKSPFEVYVDNNIQELEDQPAVLLVESRSLSSVKMTYGDKAKDVTADNNTMVSTGYQQSLAYMTGSGYGMGQGRSEHDEDGAVTLYRLFLKHHDEHEEGLVATMTGDQHVLETVEPYPYTAAVTGRKYYPLVHVRYDDVPGRFWAKTPLDDLVPKQRQRNEIESLYQTILMRGANPVWTIPHGVQTTPITGDPLIVIRYSGMGGNKPERLPGMDAPSSIIHFLTQIDQDFEEIANTFAVMKGKNPGSVRAASAIQMLLERGFGRYGSVFDNLEEAYEKWAIQALEIWRQKAVFPRVQAVAQAAGSWQFMEFVGSDLGEVDIRVEAGSTRPKSQASRQMLVGQMLQWGLLNPQDPEQRMKLFEELGATQLLPGAEADVKVVAEENMKFMEWAQHVQQGIEGQTEPIDPRLMTQVIMSSFPIHGNAVFDHHPTHVVHHRRFALSEQFRSLPQVVQQLFAMHIIQEHLPYLLMEAQTGLGISGLMSGMTPPQQQQGNKGQSTSKKGSPEAGAGPGGSGPFGPGTKNSGGAA